MKQLEQLLEDLHRQLLSAQILTESLADLLIAKNVLSKEEIEAFCNGKVEAVKRELEKRKAEEMMEMLKSIPKKTKKQKTKKQEDLHRQLLSAQILTESLADLLIAKGVLTREEVEGFCNGKVEAVKRELEKRREEEMMEMLKSIPKKTKKQKIKKQEDTDEPKITSMFMGTQIGEA